MPALIPPLRVGQIDFLNCLPLNWGMQQVPGPPTVQLVRDSPDRLSDALVRGDLDLGPISAVEALRHPAGLVMLPEVAVCADGPVQSVCLVSRLPLADLHGRTVALGATSRTSVELARLVLEHRYGVQPRYEVMPPDLDTMMRTADAAVLIGDPALRAYLGREQAPALTVTDLAQEWVEWQGLPMTFAVWAVRRDVLEARAGEVAAVRAWFDAGLACAAAAPRAVAEAGAEASGLDAEALEAYFRGLTLRPSALTWQGLERFAGLVGRVTDSEGFDALLPPLLSDR